MSVITMKKLLEGGVHFGHQTRRWDPRMARYIYTSRNGIYIVDLNKTQTKVDEAYSALKAIVDKGGKVLFVGTKKQAHDIVMEEALRSGSFYINQRWLGGILTNFRTIQKRIKRLQEIEAMEADGSINKYPKKEVVQIRKEAERLEKFLGGIKEMKKIPDAIFVIDPVAEHNAVAEAKKLRIPVFGIVDTNANPEVLDFPIPGNDDAIRSIRLIVSTMADAVCEAKNLPLVVAHTGDESENDVTMNDAIRSVDEAAERDRRRRQERFEANQRRRENNKNRRPGRDDRPRREYNNNNNNNNNNSENNQASTEANKTAE